MSLKAFHVVFVAVSILLTLVVSSWSFGNYRDGGSARDLAFGIASLLAGAGLAVYGRVFLKKFKNISYL
ncbi:MAG: hypothetical protein J0L84_11680 [Verrucomicrobia bacterium]|nr:hypothetical protein [Verrucomicrobiota bacterium]